MSTSLQRTGQDVDPVRVDRIAPSGDWLVVAATDARATALLERALPRWTAQEDGPVPGAVATAGYLEPTWRAQMRSLSRATPALVEIGLGDVERTLELLRWLAGWEAPVCLVAAEPGPSSPFRPPRSEPGAHATPVRLDLGGDVRLGWVWWPYGSSGSRRTREQAGALRRTLVESPGPGGPPHLVRVPATEPVLFRAALLQAQHPTQFDRRPGGRAGNSGRLVLETAPDDPPLAVAAHVVRAALWGLPAEVLGDPGWRDHVAPELLDTLDAVFARPVEARRRERQSVRLRRLAHRHHTATPARRVSVVLATRRADWLPHAFDQILGQRYRPLELVVAAHGEDVAAAAQRLLAARDPLGADVVVCHQPVEVSLGELLNHATEHATGDVIAKMDDDDWYGAEHVDDLLLAFDRSGAVLVGKAAEFVYLAGFDHTVRRHTEGAEAWSTLVAGGTLAIRRHDLRAVGGWAPVRRAVDQRLIDAVRGHGEVPYRTHGFGYVLNRHGVGHTWTVDELKFVKARDPQWAGLALDMALTDE